MLSCGSILPAQFLPWRGNNIFVNNGFEYLWILSLNIRGQSIFLTFRQYLKIKVLNKETNKKTQRYDDWRQKSFFYANIYLKKKNDLQVSFWSRKQVIFRWKRLPRHFSVACVHLKISINTLGQRPISFVATSY